MLKINQPDNYMLFSNWFDEIMKQEWPIGIVAYNFNLYEGLNGTYDIQLVGTDEYDENDEDWTCTDCFTTGENVYYINRTKDIANWDAGLLYIKKLVKQYLVDGAYPQTLKKATAIGVGFVDGDIDIIHRGNK